MRISFWMKHPVYTVRPLDSVRHAREILTAKRVNQLPVVVDGRVVGIISDRDVRDVFPSVVAPPPSHHRPRTPTGDPAVVTVEMAMTTNVLTLTPTDSVTDAARLMRSERIGAVPIVEAGRLVGILTRSDLLDCLVDAISTNATLPVS